MAKLIDLLQGCSGVTPEELETHIKRRANELKLKLFLDDGDKNIFVPKARLDAEIVKTVDLKNTIAEQQSAMGKLEKLTKDNEQAQTTISELNTKMDSLKQTMKDNALSLALKSVAMEHKAMDESGNDLLAFIDRTKLIINEDGSVTGLNDAVKSLKASKTYLFHNETEPTPQPAGTPGTPFLGTGNPGRPSAGGVPGSKSKKVGDFGAMLSNEFGNTVITQDNAQPKPPVYDFFK